MEKLYFRVDIDSCKRLNGMDIDEATMKWWSEQSQEARTEIFDPSERIDISTALRSLQTFVKDANRIFAHSPQFDCIILENAFNLCGIKVPWNFWQLRDTRTIYDLAGVRLKDFAETGQPHHALYDCYSQIKALIRSYENLGL